MWCKENHILFKYEQRELARFSLFFVKSSLIEPTIDSYHSINKYSTREKNNLSKIPSQNEKEKNYINK